ncbi:MAG: hypothetical protein N3A69_05225 [Leptospiraceae bacterium]|nr:hypothetical protein [Leptospiraceae bacterium]
MIYLQQYDIHGLLSLQIKTEKKDILKGFGLNYFLTEKIKYPTDIFVSLGDFEPKLDECRIYEENFFVRDNFIYGRGSSPKTVWALQIEDLEKFPATVKINIKSVNSRYMLSPSLCLINILIPLIELKLFYNKFHKKSILLHSGAVAKDGNGYLLSGRGGSFKTSIVMDLVRKGYEYLGDDRVIIETERIYSFPTHLPIFNFLLERGGNEELDMFSKLRLGTRLLFLKEKKIKYNFKIAQESKLDGLIFLNPSKKPWNVRELDKKTAARKMVLNIILENFEIGKILGLEISPMFECFEIYKAAYPKSKIYNFYQDVRTELERIFSRIPSYEVTIPLTYQTKTSEFVKKIIEKGDKYENCNSCSKFC